MRTFQSGIWHSLRLFALMLFLVACNEQLVLKPVSQAELTPTPSAVVEHTSTSTTTSTTGLPTTTSTPTGTAIASPTPLPATATETSTQTAPATPSATATIIPTSTATDRPAATPTATPTVLSPPPTMTPTPEPEPQSGRYPAIPSGKGLLYVINFHGDEVQFRFIDRPEQYVIPGKQVAPEGGVLELFIDPGSYGWVGEIPFANLKGEGALDVVEGQIQGLGLVQGKLGSQDVIEGFPIGSDPLAPPVAPTPTPPTPSPNKALLLLRTDIAPGDVTFRDQHYPLEVGQTLTLELDPGFYDINFTFLYACELEGCPLQIVNNHQVELQSNSVCELFADKEPGGAFTLQCQ